MDFTDKTARWALAYHLFCGLVFPAAPPCVAGLINLATDAHDYPPAAPGTSEFLLRTASVDGKPYHDVLVIREEDNGFGFFTRRIEREVREGAPVAKEVVNGQRPPLQPLSDSRRQHFARIFPVLNKNLDSYRRRRKEWSDEFINNREKDAWDYLDDSIYIEVESKSTGEPVAGIRFILSPYSVEKDGEVVAAGKFTEKYFGPQTSYRGEPSTPQGEGLPKPVRDLPVETELGIHLSPRIPGRVGSWEKFSAWYDSKQPSIGPNGKVVNHTTTFRDGMKMEAGALYVDENLPAKEHAIAWGEVWLAWLGITQSRGLDPVEAYYAQEVHAYADKVSRRLYIPLGMELTPEYQKDGAKKVFEIGDSVPPIVKSDGSAWWPIVYHPENIEAFFRAWRAGSIPRYNDHVAPRLEALRQQDRLPPSLLEADKVVNDFLSPNAAQRSLAEANLKTLMHHMTRHADMSYGDKTIGYENVEIMDRAKRAVYALNDIRKNAVDRLTQARAQASTTERARIDAQLKKLELDGYARLVAAPPRRGQSGFYVLEPFASPGK